MMFHLVQFLLWILKSSADYLMLKAVCRFQERRTWMIAFRILLNAILSLSNWTINAFPFWLAWLLQVIWDLVMIVDLRRKSLAGIILWRHLVYVMVLESGWILSICVFWKWSAALFVPEGDLFSAILGMIGSLLMGSLQFGALTRMKPEDLDWKTSTLLIGMTILNVISAQTFIYNGAHDQYFCLLTGLYSTLLILAAQFIVRRIQLKNQEERIREREKAIQKANETVDEKNEQLREIRHSLKNHMGIVRILNRENRKDEVEAYLKEIAGECDEASFQIYCEDPVLNALFSQMVEAHCGIHFDLLIDPQIKSVPVGLQEAIFLAMDNACEELERHPDLPQMIEITMRVEKENLICVIRNPLSSSKSLQSEKGGKDHGIGLKRIDRKIQELDGTMAICQDSYFTLSLTVPYDME